MSYDVKPYVDLLKKLSPQSQRLTLDSRTLGAGDVFLAIPGLRVDGRDFLEAASQKAAAVVYEDDGVRRTFGVPAIAVPELKAHLGEFAAHFYGDASRFLRGIAMTGTNGKTTSSHWISQLFSMLGEPCAAIGTIGCMMQGKPFKSAALTTPDAVSLQGLLSELKQAGAKAFAVEASSIGLEQGRLNGTHFDVALFTNLTRDHLDYHQDMAEYERAKAILFDWPKLKSAVINIDDEAGVRMAEKAVHRKLDVIVTTTRGAIALPGTRSLSADHVRATETGVMFQMTFDHKTYSVEMGIVGEFNISNLLGVVGVALASGYTMDAILAVLPKLQPPAGRMQRVIEPGSALVVVDYSHTPDAVEKALEALRPIATARRGKLWVIVGAGGDRDAGKRPIMASIAERMADEVVLTSDNPRTEDPQAILNDMVAGVTRPVKVVIDRREAIQYVVNTAAENDVVLIAGKGHEDYQEIQGIKYPFSDVVETRNAARMKHQPSDALMTAGMLAKLLPGSQFLGSNVPFTNVTTDTRQTTDGTLFFALKGERFDAHDFVDEAMRMGAVALVVERPVKCPLPQIVVRDVKLALGASAAYWRRHKAIQLIAVAGSNGKTTTTQMIASILRVQFGEKMLATQGNFNNDIGVPLMLWKLRDHHEVAVIETGMNHVGEMRYLGGLVQPTVALVNNAQREHQEFLQTVEATARENGEVLRALSPSGVGVFPSDDECVGTWLEMSQNCQILTFARRCEADVTGTMSPLDDGIRVHVKTYKGSFSADIRLFGEHNLHNALAATSCALALNLSLETIKAGLEAFRPVSRRGEVHRLAHGIMIDDSYNANPDSMRAAVDVLATKPSPRLLVLGDMGEVGDRAEEFHAEIGAYAAERGIEAIIATGAEMHAAVCAYNEHKKDGAVWVEKREKFIERVLELAPQYQTMLVKGSNFMKLDQVVRAVKEQYGN